ncbi:FMN-dependent NADH-azoreductase 1 [compost metagenome]
MYNWSIPSHLKAYLDHVLRFNETFGIAAGAGNVRYKGLLKSKRLLLIMTRGSSDYQFGGRNSHMDFQSGYLKLIFSIMGIDNITEITVDGLNDVPQVRESNINKASNQLSEFIASHL